MVEEEDTQMHLITRRVNICIIISLLKQSTKIHVLTRFVKLHLFVLDDEPKIIDSRDEQKLRKYFAEELQKEGKLIQISYFNMQ